MVEESIAPVAPAVSCRLTRNEAAVITSVEESMVDVLGWRPDQLIGSPSTGLIHPEDQASAVSAWFEMLGAPGLTKRWRGRYRTASGDWQWVESINTNQLADTENPVVLSVMTRVTVAEVTVEEELRARKQLMSRLADALPVGIFQIDSDGSVTFTNDRLHDLLGVPPAASAAAQFAVVVDQDRALLDSALEAVLNDQPVDDVELRFHVAVPHPEFAATRVCQVSLRPLTDPDGTVTGAIGCLSDITSTVELRRELQIRAAVDGLTGCLNRTATFELLVLTLRQSVTSKAGLAVLFIDLDDFKAVNDNFGHAAGDHALVQAADRIRAAIRAVDSIGRIGGDEFLVICPDIPTAEAAQPIALRVSDALQSPLAVGGRQVRMGASVGAAWTNQGSTSADTLIAHADRAMYESKQSRTPIVTVRV